MKYHAVMLDETRCEFGVSFEAENEDAAYEYLAENYPESKVEQLETPAQSAAREKAIYDHIARGGDWDEDDRPFFPHGDEWADDDGEE